MSCSPLYRSDRGQTTPLTAVVLAVAMLITLGVGVLARSAADAARARGAADAAALAAAGGGVDAAREVTEANAAVLESVRSAVDPTGTRWVVETRVGDQWSTAAALAEHRPGTEGLDPAMVLALARAEELLGEPIPVVSGFRSRAEQEALWLNRHANPYPVAPPGTSDHERGLAIDVPRWFVPRLRSVAEGAGLCQPLPVSDPVHFTACRTTATR